MKIKIAVPRNSAVSLRAIGYPRSRDALKTQSNARPSHGRASAPAVYSSGQQCTGSLAVIRSM